MFNLKKLSFFNKNKKGFTEVDSVISFMIFLLYVTWFFYTVKIVQMPDQNLDYILDDIYDYVYDNCESKVYKYPFFVSSNMNDTFPIELTLPFSVEDYFFSKPSVIEGIKKNQFTTFDEVNNNLKYYQIIYGNYTYNKVYSSDYTIASNSTLRLSNLDLTLFFDDNFLSQVFYQNHFLFNLSDISLNSKEISRNLLFSQNDLFSRYSVTQSGIESSITYFNTDDKLRMRFKKNYNSSSLSRVSFDFEFNDLISVYVDNTEYESSNLNISKCYDFSNNELIMDVNDVYLVYKFEDEIDFSLCNQNTTSKIEFSIPFMNTMKSHISLIDSLDEYNSGFYDINIKKGFNFELIGLNEDLFKNLLNKDYFGFKNDLNIKKDFSFYLFDENRSIIYAYNETNPDLSDEVYSKTYEIYFIDQLYLQTKYFLNIRVW